MVMPAFSGRVRRLGGDTAGIEITGASALESGNYSVAVLVENAQGHSFKRYQKRAYFFVSGKNCLSSLRCS
jgi:hypothetical protein